MVVRVLYHFLERGGTARSVVLARPFGRDIAVQRERRLDLDNLGFRDYNLPIVVVAKVTLFDATGDFLLIQKLV